LRVFLTRTGLPIPLENVIVGGVRPRGAMMIS
jgi:hypothetical protein